MHVVSPQVEEVRKPRKSKIRTAFKPTQFVVREKKEESYNRHMYEIKYGEKMQAIDRAESLQKELFEELKRDLSVRSESYRLY